MIWLPVTGGESDQGTMQTVIREHVQEVSELIRSYWKDDSKS